MEKSKWTLEPLALDLAIEQSEDFYCKDCDRHFQDLREFKFSKEHDRRCYFCHGYYMDHILAGTGAFDECEEEI